MNAARAGGQRITADMYTYTAGATGLDAAMPTWVQSGGLEDVDQAAEGPGDPRAADQGNAHALERLGESAAARRKSGPRTADRVQEPEAETAHREDLGRGCAHARQEPRRDRNGPGHRGRQPRRHRLFPDERGQCEARGGAAVDELRLRRGIRSARGRVPEVEQPPPRLRQFRPRARRICAQGRRRDPARCASGG